MTMPALDNLLSGTLNTVLAPAADLLNSVYLPAATAGSVAAALLAVPCLLALLSLTRPRAGQPAAATLVNRIDDLNQRLALAEGMLDTASTEAAQVRQRVDQLTSRPEGVAGGTARNGLRQAIALSRHGATTRQLIETCALSQGEAHLIQSLYGRPPGNSQPEELH